MGVFRLLSISPETAFTFGAVLGVIFTLLSFLVEVYPKIKQVDRDYKALQSENARLKNALEEMGWF